MTDNEAGRLKDNRNVSVVEDFQIEGIQGDYQHEACSRLTEPLIAKAHTVGISGEVIPQNMQTIGADRVWPHATGKGVKVAVLDTGIWKKHPDLEVRGGVHIRNGKFVSKKGWNDDNKGSHGTHSAGIIGARKNREGVCGVAYDCNLYAVKILDKNTKGHFSNLVKALCWADHNSMDVVSMSCRWTDNEIVNEDVKTDYCLSLRRLVDKLNQKGCVLVAASGNKETETSETMICEPALEPGVIAVGAINRLGLADERVQYCYHQKPKPPLWPFSCWKPAGNVDICAPGVDVNSTVKPGPSDEIIYGLREGTSVACPHVAGAAVLLKELHPTWTSNQIRDALCRNAWNIGNEKHKDDQTGYGLLDCYASFHSTHTC
jgi:subtilisin family serine protease